MATWTTYGADTELTGMAEDVSGIISNITPTETPFQTMIGKDGCSARNPEWQEDALAAVRDNRNVEGADASDQTPTETTMRFNYTQILEATVKVSETSDAVQKHGRAKELSYQLSKKGAEVKRDLEHALVGTAQTKVLGDGTSTARAMDGYQSMIAAGVQIDASAVTYGVAPNELQEQMILDQMQALYDAGATFSVLMVKPSDSLYVANFAYSTGRQRDLLDGRKIVNVIDLYMSPFGTVSVVLNRFQRVTDAMVFDPDMWDCLTLRDWKRRPLAKVGDANREQIIGEKTLKHRNFSGSGLIHTLDT